MTDETPSVPIDALAAAAQVIGLELSEDQLASIATAVAGNRATYAALRAHVLPNDLWPAVVFNPLPAGVHPRLDPVDEERLGEGGSAPGGSAPSDELAWAGVADCFRMLRRSEVTSRELASAAVERLRALDRSLNCIAALTEDRAQAAAAAADREASAGRWRGPLHGIPWGAKDLMAATGHPTAWGSPVFAGQRFDHDATVVRKLDEAGAILVAKLSTGELAMGDRWSGGRTNSPWNVERGSSGSSAGPSAATGGGGVPFALGTETLGSIMSPSARCGCSSLRPTFGRVSRSGVMTLCSSFDKVGPICRSLLDVALVFAAIVGPDGLDVTVHDLPFTVPAPADLRGVRIGVLEEEFGDRDTGGVVDELRELGAVLVPFILPAFNTETAMLIIGAESASTFDELVRSGRAGDLANQGPGSWAEQLRTSQFTPAVEYLRAQRLRARLSAEMDDAMASVDAIVHPTDGAASLAMGNLTGRPATAAPWARREGKAPGSVAFTGHLFGEAKLLAIGRRWQEQTGYHLAHPSLPASLHGA